MFRGRIKQTRTIYQLKHFYGLLCATFQHGSIRRDTQERLFDFVFSLVDENLAVNCSRLTERHTKDSVRITLQ